MVEAVFLALQDKLVAVPGQEDDGVEGLYILVACLAVEFRLLLARFGIIAHQAAVVLLAVEFEEIDGLVVGTPGDVGEITVGGVARLQICHRAGGEMTDAHRHLMAGHARHGIFVGLIPGTAGKHVHLRIVGHHRLVHAVECESLAAVIPEDTLHDAEFVAVYRLSVDYLTAAVGGQLV